MNHLGDANKMVGEDHIRDATKMVSDTPRTDEAYFKNSATMYDLAGEMKRVERELNAANEKIEVLLIADCERLRIEEELNAANERIKRLEEALEGTVKWIVHLADSGDAGFWDVEKQSEIIAARAALKKESKP